MTNHHLSIYGFLVDKSSPLLSMAALSVEHLKVMAALTVEPAYAFNLLICPSNKSKNGRAPKGPYQSST